ncbi:MAG: flagellar biosynthetic protein FliR [Bryobacteraceae bacterium]|nr:flagellar biosynthetic protein FliR [Bryobacteraceae bacterium]
MPAEIGIPVSTLYGFLLVLARVAGAFSFVPIPGFRQTPGIARVVLAAGLTIALAPVWPRVEAGSATAGLLAAWMLAELAFGAAVGVAVAFLNEAFVLSSQIFGLQAGYGYASTIDPSTEADSSVLQIFTHLASGLLFFSFGMDRQIVRLAAESLETVPPGTFLLSLGAGEQILKLGATMFSTAVRLALPVVALLILVDISLALLGRINSHLQLLTLAFPAKMLVSLGMLAALTAVLPPLYRTAADSTMQALRAALLAGQ